MANKPSRAVTHSRTCLGCLVRFKPPRRNARYCSPACRQRGHRARAGVKVSDLDREIEAARLRYWCLLAEKARAQGIDISGALTQVAVYVDIDGNVYEGFPGQSGRYLGRTTPHRPGWAAWGLEAAAPPWRPPPAEKEALRENEALVKRARAARQRRRNGS